MPICTGLFEYVWDPLSTKQSLLAVALVKQLATDYPTVAAQNKATQVMLIFCYNYIILFLLESLKTKVNIFLKK